MSEPNGNRTTKVILDYIEKDLERLAHQVEVIDNKLDQGYVTREIFEIRVGRVEKIVYGVAGLVGTAVIVALLTLVIK